MQRPKLIIFIPTMIRARLICELAGRALSFARITAAFLDAQRHRPEPPTTAIHQGRTAPAANWCDILSSNIWDFAAAANAGSAK